MASANPHSGTKHESSWRDGYEQAQANRGALFGKPPAHLSPDHQERWKEGWRAGKQDLRADADADMAPESEMSPTVSPLGHGPVAATADASEERAWKVTVDGKAYEHVPTKEAQKALEKVASVLARRVSVLSDYQSEFDSANPWVVNVIMETAGGFHYQPNAAVWGELDNEIAAAQGAISAGQIHEAAERLTKTSEAVAKAAEAWDRFLDHYYRGGHNTVAGLEATVKLSIGAEAVLITVATGGADSVVIGAATGAGGSGLNEYFDQWVGMKEGKQASFDWTKISEEALIGALLGGTASRLSGPWAELLASKAPAIVGANTALLSRISATFIDSETGARMTAEALAVKMEPLWGKAVTKLSAAAIRAAASSLLHAGLGAKTDPHTFAQTLDEHIEDAAWEMAIEETLKEAGLTEE